MRSSSLADSSTSFPLFKDKIKRDIVLVQYRITKEDYKNVHAFAEYLYQKGAISRPSVPVLGKIALFKMYNDFMERFRTKVEQGQQRKQQQSQNSEDNDDWFK